MRTLCRLMVAMAVGAGGLVGASTAAANNVCWSNSDCSNTNWLNNVTAPGTAHHTWQRIGITNATGFTLSVNVWNNASENGPGWGNVCVSNGMFSYNNQTNYNDCVAVALGYAHGKQTTRGTAPLHGHAIF